MSLRAQRSSAFRIPHERNLPRFAFRNSGITKSGTKSGTISLIIKGIASVATLLRNDKYLN